jgi:hypothetical protein
MVAEGFPQDRIERVGRLKLGFDNRAHRMADEATGEVFVKRVEVKGHLGGSRSGLPPTSGTRLYSQKGGSPDFPVRMRDGRIVSSLAVSGVLNNVPVLSVDYVFAQRDVFDQAENWLKENRNTIIEPQKEDVDNG